MQENVQQKSRTTAAPSTFLAEYDRLNEAQRQAVDQIDGAVMVVAGPGTGKTQLLAMRVANIVLQTQLKPHNILVLTFTDSAVHNVRQRLVRIMGEAGYQVRVHTFHSFCQEVIQDNPDIFSFARNLSAISAVEQAEAIEKILDTLPANSPLKPFGNSYLYLPDITRAISQLKQEHLTPEALRAFATDLNSIWKNVTSSIESFAGLKAGDRTVEHCRAVAAEISGHLSRASSPSVRAFARDLSELLAELEEQQEAAEGKRANQKLCTAFKNSVVKWHRTYDKQLPKYQALADVYGQYQEHLKKSGQYDFEDMILMTLKKLKEHDDLRAEYQEQFQYFLVDEYQDTNGAQNELLFTLAEFMDEPNVFVVGDDKQAIFRFQGASLDNLIDFYERYQDSVTIVPLTTNYRSTQSVLDAAIALNSHQTDRLTDYIPGLKTDLESTFSSQVPAVTVNEYVDPASESNSTARHIQQLLESKVAPSEIAVLCRTNAEAARFVDVLRRHCVPATLRAQQNVLISAAVRQAITAMSWAVSQRDEVLWQLLHAPALLVHPVAVAEAMQAVRSKRISLMRATSDSEELEPVLRHLSEWSAAAAFDPVARLLARIVQDLGLVEYYTEVAPDPDQLVAIDTLMREAREFSSANPDARAKDFLQHLRLMAKHRLALQAASVSDRESVQVMTAHRAKGLEFEHVYIVNVAEKVWSNRPSFGRLELPRHLITTRPHAHHFVADERRLFYVALTRAKKNVYVSYPTHSDSGRDTLSSQFISELPPSLPTVTHEQLPIEQAIKAATTPPVAHTERLKRYLTERLSNYKLSVTHLSNFLECPKLYLYRNLLQAPALKTKHMAFGTAIHATLRDAFEAHHNRGAPVPLPQLIEKFYDYIEHEDLPNNEREEVRQLGTHVLTSYWKRWQATWTHKTLLEYNFASHNVRVGDAPITGLIDKVEILDEDSKHVRVVDYKTGQPDYKRAALKAGGDYHRQLVFYKLLCEHSTRFEYTMKEGEIDFVQPNKKGKFIKETVSISDEDARELAETIHAVWKKITSLEFLDQPGCGYCEMCDLLSSA